MLLRAGCVWYAGRYVVHIAAAVGVTVATVLFPIAVRTTEGRPHAARLRSSRPDRTNEPVK